MGKAFWKASPVAVKQFRTPITFKAFRQEAQMHGSLRHPSVAPLLGVCRDPYTLITEMPPHLTLRAFLDTATPMTWHLRLRLTQELTEALKYLHGLAVPVAHLAVCSVNVLLFSLDHTEKKGACVKFCHYGHARAIYGPLLAPPHSDWRILAPEVTFSSLFPLTSIRF